MEIITSIDQTLSNLRPNESMYSMKLQRCRAKTSLAIWRKSSAQIKDVHRATKRLAYDAGVLSENLFLQLLKLDGLEGDDAVRKARKAKVLEIKADMSRADQVRSGALRLQEFQEKRKCFQLAKSEEQTRSEELSTMVDDTASNVEDCMDSLHLDGDTQMATGQEEEAPLEDDGDEESESESEAEAEAEAEVDDEAEDEAGADEEEDEGEAEDADQDSEAEDDDAEMTTTARKRLPKWMRQQRTSEGVEVFMALPGVSEKNIDIRIKGRDIIVSSSRHHFEEAFSVPSSLDLENATCEFDKGVLTIKLPYLRRQRPRPRFSANPYGYGRERDMDSYRHGSSFGPGFGSGFGSDYPGYGSRSCSSQLRRAPSFGGYRPRFGGLF